MNINVVRITTGYTESKQMQAKNGCPFCGFCSVQVWKSIRGCQVACNNCGARGPSGMADRDSALAVWENGDVGYTRPTVPDRMSEIEPTGQNLST